MASGSTASSDTEGRDPEAAEGAATGAPPEADRPGTEATAASSGAPEEPEASVPSGSPEGPDAAGVSPHDAARRAFFFEFGKQAVTAVGQVAAMADIVGRTSSTAAASLLSLGETPTAASSTGVVRKSHGTRSPVAGRTDGSAIDDVYRSSYRLVDDELVLLDQRTIPGSIEELTVRRGSDIAYYLRIGAIRGGPVMAQVAAYGVALTATERAGQPIASRRVELKRTRRALAAARPSSRLVAWAMDRMEVVEASFGEDEDGTLVALALRREADTIAADFQTQHSTIAERICELMPATDDRPLGILLHGDSGALAGGLVGTGLAAVQQLAASDRDMDIFVTETRPFMDGARLVGWQLRQAGIAHRIITDSSVAWLLAREPIDVVLVAADWIAMDADCAAVIGSRALAQQVGASGGVPDRARPRLIVSAISATIDPATPDGAAIPLELRPARDLDAYLSDVPVRSADALVPACDVIPHERIDVLVTERGSLQTPDATAIAAMAPQVAPSARAEVEGSESDSGTAAADAD